MLASDKRTRLLDGYEVKMTDKNCPNYTIKEEMHGQLCKNWEKHTGSCLILAKTVCGMLPKRGICKRGAEVLRVKHK